MYFPEQYSSSEAPSPKGGGELVSFPASVQRRLDEAETLLDLNRPTEALSAFQLAWSELARTQPELLVLVAASQAGFRQLSLELMERETTRTETQKFLLGFRIGYEFTEVTTTRANRRSFGLS